MRTSLLLLVVGAVVGGFSVERAARGDTRTSAFELAVALLIIVLSVVKGVHGE